MSKFCVASVFPFCVGVQAMTAGGDGGQRTRGCYLEEGAAGAVVGEAWPWR